MKAIAFNTSPCGKNGYTEKILQPFLAGLKESGTELKLYYTNELDIQPCRGCTDETTFESNGKCLCDDDMNDLYPQFRESDIWIFASPNYPNNISPVFKNLLDRLEPLYQPVFETNGSPDYEKQQEKDKTGKIVFISSGGLWEKESFNQIEDQIRSVSTLFNMEFAGSLLRPHSWALDALAGMGYEPKDIYEAAYKAGAEVVKNGSMPADILNNVSRELVPKENFMNELHDFIKNFKNGGKD